MGIQNEKLQKIFAAGVVGGGGAGFPTWKKLDTHVEYVIINGAECEPLLECDQYLMRHHAERMIRALHVCGDITGATNLTVALKNTYKDEIAALQTAIRQSRSSVTLSLLDPIYPAGDEQVVIQRVTGRIVPPAGLPSQVGCVVISVSTALAIADALEGISSTNRLVTVAGEIPNPQIFMVPVGTPVMRLLEASGLKTLGGLRIVMGGPMMGKLLPKDAHDTAVITKTDGGILVLPEDHPIVKSRALSIETTRRRAASVCIQCRFCTDMCPRYALGHNIQPHLMMRAVAHHRDTPESTANARLCSECGLCETYACPMGLSPRNINAALKQNLGEYAQMADKTVYTRGDGLHASRGIHAGRLAIKAGVAKYSQRMDHVTALHVNRVSIPLKQHIGAPCLAVVQQGESVHVGQLIGNVPEGALGAPVHASISGMVVQATNSCIIIEGGA